MKDFIACAIQFWAKPNRPAENLRKISRLIKKAIDLNNPQLIVFPESCTTGFTPNMSNSEFYKLIETIPGPCTDKIGELARKYKTNIVLPIYEKGKIKNQIFNSACIIDSLGNIRGVHRKTHPFPAEKKWTTPGQKAEVFDIDVCKIGVVICYEGDFPEVSRLLVLKGAEVLIRPAALLRSIEIWDSTNKARAYDNNVYVIATNAIGTDAGGNHFFGHSSIISPIAEKLVQAYSDEEIIFSKITQEAYKYVSYGSKYPMLFNHIKDRNIDVS